MEDRARVVIVGAGIVGCSVAEHLTRMGWTDVIVLDQGPLDLPGGSTSHAPGLMFQTNPSKTMTAFAKYTVERFSELELDGRPCCLQVGGIEVATTPERWKDLRRKQGIASAWGIESHLISPEECAGKIPMLDESKILGGFFTPTDGIAKAVWACEAMMKLATERGARFYGNTEVLGFEVEGGRIKAVETSRGRIEAEIVLSCAGMWGPKLGRMVGMTVPLTPMQHQFVWTGAVPGLEGETREAAHPILRHQDAAMYMRQNGEKYGIGSYQHRSMTVESEDIEPPSLSADMPSIMEFTPEDWDGPWRDAVELLPALGGIEFERPMNGLFSFTPDGMPMLGESKAVRGFWVAEAVWITHSHGVARAMAEWLTEGAPDTDISGCDVNRFDSHAYSPAYTLARSSQSFQEVYDVIHPQQPMDEPRPLRTSPFYLRQRELGAYFLEANGWERPHWFASNEDLADEYDLPERDEWSGRYWSRAVAAEHKATRERVALYDMTSLKKAEVSGPGALDLLQKLNTNQLDKPPGSVTYTLMLDEKGGVRSDITVARLGEEHFQLGLNGARDMDWMERHLPDDSSVRIRDITSGTCCVGVWGPYAREVVQSLTADDFSNEAFGFFKAKRAYIGEVPVVALRVSYVGELGWEIYTTPDYGLRLWGLLWRAGQEFGVVAGGRGAFNGLRLEKGYRLYGTDMTTEHDPYEAGLAFAVKPDKGDFIGREALMRRREEGPRRKLSCLVLEGGKAMMGGEPVFHNGGESIGYVTSAEYGHAIQKSIAYAWLEPSSAEVGTKVEIQYFSEKYEATVTEEPLFDPAMEKMRGAKKSERSEVSVANGRPLVKAKS